ncbi:MAG TPA: hypothetical protein VEU62_14780 [Bryobacterales bacterium]|nr:hypothetical protein [Bryobacterales bacterium]
MRKPVTSLVLLLGAAAWLNASTVVRLSFSQLSTLAQRVEAGRIERITSYHDPSSGRIMSRIEIAPWRPLGANAAPAPLSLEMTGGAVGDLRQWIAGFPNLQVGDRVVLFLAGDTSTPLGPTVGLWQGIFFIATDPATGADIITDHRRRPVVGIENDELVLGQAPGEAGAPGARPLPIPPVRQAGAGPLTLNSFLGRVQALRAASAAAAKR